MTISEIAQLVCDKLGKPDPESLRVCRQFARTQYRILYNSAIWQEALWVIDIPVDKGTAIVVVPSLVDRVVAARWNNGLSLTSDTHGRAFATDPDGYFRSGTPARYIVLSPVATGAQQNIGGKKLDLRSTAQDGARVQVRGVSGGRSVSELVTLAGQARVVTQYTYDFVESISKPSTTGALEVYLEGGMDLMARIEAAESARSHQRVQLADIPDGDGVLHLLGKRRLEEVTDHDTPMLPGMEASVLALAEADMLERMRQYAKAQAKRAEALKIQVPMVFDLAKHQQPSTPVLVPDIYEPSEGIF